MMRQRLFLMAGITALLVLAANQAHAGTVVVSARPAHRVVISRPAGIGVWIGHPPVRRFPYHRKAVVTGPWRRRFVRIGPAVAHPPVVREVVVAPRPVATVPPAPVVVHHVKITLWITNSNGSRTAVKLTRSGPWYVGPRGEYYETLPTNEQLRVIYGV
jgi:hypothetical protein